MVVSYNLLSWISVAHIHTYHHWSMSKLLEGLYLKKSVFVSSFSKSSTVDISSAICVGFQLACYWVGSWTSNQSHAMAWSQHFITLSSPASSYLLSVGSSMIFPKPWMGRAIGDSSTAQHLVTGTWHCITLTHRPKRLPHQNWEL